MKDKFVSMSDKRGAALILEIIIYLVIVALIAVAVTSGVRAIRDLVFTSHGKGDIQNIQTWMEGKYSQDGVYPGTAVGVSITLNYADVPKLTAVGPLINDAYASSKNGADAGYCILVYSPTMSNPAKQRFWITSARPHTIIQSGTGSNGNSTVPPDSGISGVTCAM